LGKKVIAAQIPPQENYFLKKNPLGTTAKESPHKFKDNYPCMNSAGKNSTLYSTGTTPKQKHKNYLSIPDNSCCQRAASESRIFLNFNKTLLKQSYLMDRRVE
jgi:hypothetical protein